MGARARLLLAVLAIVIGLTTCEPLAAQFAADSSSVASQSVHSEAAELSSAGRELLVSEQQQQQHAKEQSVFSEDLLANTHKVSQKLEALRRSLLSKQDAEMPATGYEGSLDKDALGRELLALTEELQEVASTVDPNILERYDAVLDGPSYGAGVGYGAVYGDSADLAGRRRNLLSFATYGFYGGPTYGSSKRLLSELEVSVGIGRALLMEEAGSMLYGGGLYGGPTYGGRKLMSLDDSTTGLYGSGLYGNAYWPGPSYGEGGVRRLLSMASKGLYGNAYWPGPSYGEQGSSRRLLSVVSDGLYGSGLYGNALWPGATYGSSRRLMSVDSSVSYGGMYGVGVPESLAKEVLALGIYAGVSRRLHSIKMELLRSQLQYDGFGEGTGRLLLEPGPTYGSGLYGSGLYGSGYSRRLLEVSATYGGPLYGGATRRLMSLDGSEVPTYGSGLYGSRRLLELEERIVKLKQLLASSGFARKLLASVATYGGGLYGGPMYGTLPA